VTSVWIVFVVGINVDIQTKNNKMICKIIFEWNSNDMTAIVRYNETKNIWMTFWNRFCGIQNNFLNSFVKISSICSL